jgi:PKD domain/WD40-like Beta Propeller Repeat
MVICFILTTIHCPDVWGQDLYSVSPIPFNTRDHNEFSAVPYKEGLVFCSDRLHNIFIAKLDSLSQPLLDLYYIRKKEKEKWGVPELLGKELSGNFHKGPMTFGKKGSLIYFTRNDAETAGIFSATFNGSAWEKITPFIYNEPNTRVAHPCLSADGKYLFFVSDKHGGYGGFDIYVCVLSHNQWGKPKNLGPEINTAHDELYPFYNSSSGRLYFASKRPNGLGGLDIYYSKEINGKWMPPVILPAPMNTSKNDFAFYSDSTDRHGYFSSDRNSKSGLTDIFEFSMNFPVLSNSNCMPQKKSSFKYRFDEVNSVNTDSTTYRYEWDFGDGTKHRGKETSIEHDFGKPGDYIVQLNVIDTLTNQIYLNQAADLLNLRNIEQPFITCKDTALTGENIVFNAGETYLPQIKNLKFYWDFNDGILDAGKEIKHKFQEPGTYLILLGVTGIDAKKQPVTFCRSRLIFIKGSSAQ